MQNWVASEFTRRHHYLQGRVFFRNSNKYVLVQCNVVLSLYNI